MRVLPAEWKDMLRWGMASSSPVVQQDAQQDVKWRRKPFPLTSDELAECLKEARKKRPCG